MRPAKTQISLGIHPVWSDSSLSAWRNIGSSATHWAHCEDWSVWVNVQADLSLRLAHMSFCWFCHAQAQIQSIEMRTSWFQDDLDDSAVLKDVTFAPRDITPIHLLAKNNTHGLGYSGLNPKSALPSTHISLFEPPAITKTRRKGIRGQVDFFFPSLNCL